MKKDNNILFSYNKIVGKRKYTDTHIHDTNELYYLIDGQTKYFIGDEIFSVEKNDFVFIPAGMFHKTDSEKCLNNERIVLHFNDDILGEEAKKLLGKLSKQKVFSVKETKLHLLTELLSQIEKETDKNDDYSDIIKKSDTLNLLAFILRFKKETSPKELTNTDLTINKITKYISSNFSEDITLSTLSQTFNISESHLSRKFKEISGIGISEYITYVRITYAQKLLKEKKLPMTQIALKCGFNDSNYFSTVFKRIKGITPLKYAKTENTKNDI